MLNRISLLIIAIVLFTGCGFKSSTKSEQEEEKIAYPYYQNLLDKNIKALSEPKIKTRDSLYNIYKALPAYNELVKQKVIDVKYLPLLTGIGEILVTYSDAGMSIHSKLVSEIKKTEGAEDFLLMSSRLEGLGGIPYEITEVVARYIGEYGYSGDEGEVKGGNKVTLYYNLALAMVVIDPNDKQALDEVGLAHKKKVYTWSDETERKSNFKHPEFNFKPDYIQYLKSNYPDSKYIPNYDLEISSIDLYEAYERNEVKADQLYKEKRLAVTGEIENIGKDILGSPYVTLVGDGYFNAVQCMVSEDLAASLDKGQIVTLLGKCKGRNLNIILEDCELE